MVAGQHAREQDAVVAAVALLAEDLNLEALASGADDLFHEARSSHPVPDDYQASIHRLSGTLPRRP